ncbi:AbrB/MazE/SpoVT family DNA-binding domain-containing protein [Halorientalis regularis]|jgi:antitoxin PrlF|uniref:Looped-hinge helix DNA binding domain-containing protein, AbrB family n=1 Tax=Halorientalis regularis TaxID=660518 RepID=A0A1G7HTA1_9EURY|nr:AbrB/MazE/SpoVT family DNA-binding domain-containing protein [Halorientalis regularis]SDF03259.1 looped-hinge helix DNA binding domain-containing protein, AbrB family [Halorientalis regularis]
MTRVTEKGQVTIPKSIREELGIRPGDEITFVETEEGYVVRKDVDESRFEKWRGVADTDDTVTDRMDELRETR